MYSQIKTLTKFQPIGKYTLYTPITCIIIILSLSFSLSLLSRSIILSPLYVSFPLSFRLTKLLSLERFTEAMQLAIQYELDQQVMNYM